MTTKTRKPEKSARPTHALRPSPHADKRARFVDEYLIDFKVKQAAIRAGYAPGSAHVTGSRLLSDANVQAMIAAKSAKLHDRYEISHDRIKRELALMGFANMYDYISMTPDGRINLDFSELTRDQAAAIQSIDFEKQKLRLHDKRASLVDLAKITGLLSDQPDVTVPVRFIVQRTRPGREIED